MHLYAIALGSNRRHGRYGSPDAVVRAAAARLGGDVALVMLSRTVSTRAVGDRGRRFANAAAIVRTDLSPSALLARLKAVERAFGRRRGKRWGSRVLDLDILLWSGGAWRSTRPHLIVPHPGLGQRRFVLDPLVTIARGWRLPGTAHTIAHAHARLTAARRIP